MMRTAISVFLNVSLHTRKDIISLEYHVNFSDGTNLEGELSVYYPIPLKCKFNIEIIKNYFQIFLSQLFLSNGMIGIACNSMEEPLYQKVTEALYAIRNYEEGLNVNPKYAFFSQDVRAVSETSNINVINLVSGGKDSLVSDYLLEINGAKISRCFIDGLNTASNSEELNACIALYDEVDIVKLTGFESLISVLGEISDCYGHPPKKNFIPRGRDVLTLALVYPLAINRGCSFISHGCEKDLWENNILANNVYVPLHDSQSSLVIEPLSQQMDIATGIHIFSPIAGMHEIYILSWLLDFYPEKIKHLQSCFFGNWCGECTKCLRYYLIEKYYRKHLFNFKKDPELLIPDLFSQLSNPDFEKSIRFYKELLYLLGNEKYKEELFKPVGNRLFPPFFERWELT